MDYRSAILDSNIGWAILAILSAFWIYLGIYWGRKAKDLEGFMLAGRNVGLALGTATAMATWITSNTTMLAPQFAIQLGIWGMLAYSTASLGLMLFAPLAQRIKSLMPKGYTSGDFIRLRYGKAAWYIFLIISIFYGITWLISMGMAGGILMNAIAGIPYKWGVTVILFVCVVYTLFGGLYAVIGTDFIQSLIILIGIFVIGVGIFMKTDFNVVHADLLKDSPMLISLLLPAAIMAVFNNMLFGIGEIFHSNVWWSRAFALRKNIVKKAYMLSGFLWIPIPVAAGFIALSTNTLGINLTSPDMVGPLVASKLLGASGAVIVFIVLFSSLASSIDSLLAATSDLISEDIVKRIIRPELSDQSLRRISSYVIIGLGLFSWLLCMPRISDLATVLFFAGPLVASTIWPIAAGLFVKRVTALAAVTAMLAGSVIGLYIYFTIGWYTASLVGAAVSMTIIVINMLTSKASFNWDNLQEEKI